jgi:hypothetical protein
MRVTQHTRALILTGAVALPATLGAQSQTASARPDSAPPTAAADPPAPAPAALAGLKISGYAEASYAWSNKAVGSNIAGRLYDRFHDQFTLNALKVSLDRPYAADRLDAGFHADIVLGENASVLQSNGLKLGDQGDMTQLYVTLNVPTPNGNGLQLKVGKIATLLGLEVIEDPSNPNWSLGNLFSFVENFTAVGASAEYRINRFADVQLRVIDGWDVVQDNNTGRSFMGRLGLAPDSLTSIGLVGYVGPEAAESNAKRFGGEVLLYRKLAGPVGAWLQLDYGRENRIVPDGDGHADKAASWWGAGAWLTLDLSRSIGLALRGDLVDDRHGTRSNGFLFPTFADGPGTRHRFGSGTATLNVKSWSNVLLRPELRFDRSNLPVFDGKRDQLTAAFGVAYLF